MRFFEGSIQTDAEGSACAFEFEVPDNATQAVIDDDAKQAAFDRVQWHYKETTPNPPPADGMRSFSGSIQTDSHGSACEFEFEIEQGASKEAVEDEAQQAAFDRVQWHFKELKRV